MKCLEFKMLYSSCDKVSLSRSSPPTVLAYLTSGIDNLCCKILSIVLNDSAECVLDRRVIAFYKMVLDETYCEGRFTWCSVSAASTCIMNPALKTRRSKSIPHNELQTIPTERLPTIAIFRCLGAVGILSLPKTINY